MFSSSASVLFHNLAPADEAAVDEATAAEGASTMALLELESAPDAVAPPPTLETIGEEVFTSSEQRQEEEEEEQQQEEEEAAAAASGGPPIDLYGTPTLPLQSLPPLAEEQQLLPLEENDTPHSARRLAEESAALAFWREAEEREPAAASPAVLGAKPPLSRPLRKVSPGLASRLNLFSPRTRNALTGGATPGVKV